MIERKQFMKRGELKALVEEILMDQPETRNSDTLLCTEFAIRTNKSFDIRDGVSWIRSVVRERAKVQQTNPMLRADAQVITYRNQLEKEEREWQRNTL